MVTDYDCWHRDHESVTVEQIIGVLTQNAANACEIVRAAVAAMPGERACKCGSALKHALLTQPDKIPAATRKKLSLLLNKYLDQKATAN
jgi:5'-methylthioadenosine phosphorylase